MTAEPFPGVGTFSGGFGNFGQVRGGATCAAGRLANNCAMGEGAVGAGPESGGLAGRTGAAETLGDIGVGMAAGVEVGNGGAETT